MARTVVPAAEELLDKEFQVLNHGFVRLVDYMGGDDRIVQAARVSYGAGTKSTSEDKGLIDYLLRNTHTSPFEQVVFTFHLKMPIFVARQWVRHRTARMNEISGRYSVMEQEFYLPDQDHIHLQSRSNRQGRDEDSPVPDELKRDVRRRFEEFHKEVYGRYQEMLDKGISRELARITLPLSLYTEFYWQMDLHNLLHFLRLRLDAHAQLEIRLYAEVLAEIVGKVTPYAWESFQRHVLRSRRLSADEVQALRDMLAGKEAALSPKRLRELKEKLGLES